MTKDAIENAQISLFVDVTELVVLDLRTGIQRVVREFVEHGIAGAAQGQIIPVVAVGSQYHRLSDAGWQKIRSSGVGANEKRITHEKGVHPLVRIAKRAAKINARLYNQLQRFHVRRLVRRRARGLYVPEPVAIGPGAKLILLDSFWGGSSVLNAARRARKAGTSVVLVVYDLIPVSHPQFCDYRLVQKFKPMMAQAAAISDGVLAISEFCAASFRACFPAAEVTAFPLGHNFRADVEARGGQWPDALWQGDPVFVIIGSIEPRKGHQTVLKAFERRWARGESNRLLIIGKVGWQVEDLMRKIENHPELGRRLFHIHNASDTMLKNALERAHAGIIASFVEGFGLPLVEILAARIPVLASDIPVFHEIAGDRATYFEPGNPIALDEAIDVLACHYDKKAQDAASFDWPSWYEAAEQFFSLIETRSPPPAGDRIVHELVSADSRAEHS